MNNKKKYTETHEALIINLNPIISKPPRKPSHNLKVLSTRSPQPLNQPLTEFTIPTLLFFGHMPPPTNNRQTNSFKPTTSSSLPPLPKHQTWNGLDRDIKRTANERIAFTRH